MLPNGPQKEINSIQTSNGVQQYNLLLQNNFYCQHEYLDYICGIMGLIVGMNQSCNGIDVHLQYVCWHSKIELKLLFL